MTSSVTISVILPFSLLLLFLFSPSTTTAFPFSVGKKGYPTVSHDPVLIKPKTPFTLPDDINLNQVVHHHSLIPPYLEDDWTGGIHDHWSYGLSTVVTSDYVRLTPNKQSREGYLWNKNPSFLASWSIDFGFRVHSLQSLGGDGFALWYAEKPSKEGGPLFGAAQKGFKGLGIIFDGYDNDGNRDNPSVYIVVSNDENEELLPQEDMVNQKLGGCTFDFRNTAESEAIRVIIQYEEGKLVVHLFTQKNQMLCATVNSVELPLGYYFGFTANTGSLADNHDIYYFAVAAGPGERELDAKRQLDAHGASDGESAWPPVYNHHEEKAEKEKWKAQ